MKPLKKRRDRGQTIVALLIAVAILAAVAAAMMGKFGGVYQGSIDRANQTACGAYTAQIRQAISMYKQDNDGKNPPSLQSLGKYGVIKDMYDAPGCSYGYDAATGEVTAPDMRPGAVRQTGPATAGAPSPAAAPYAAPNAPQSAAPPAAPGPGPRNPGNLPSTTVSGGGMSIKVPTGGGNVDVNGGN